jgi:hypothetical protein
MKKYYVYCHKNPITQEIFYVGKGSGCRAYVTQSRGKYWKNYVSKYGIPVVELLYENLEEEEAFTLEKQLIQALGRRDLGTGILVNSTDGGEGCSGYRHSEEVRQKMNASRRGSPGGNKGKTWTQKNKREKNLIKGKYKTRKDKGKTFNSEIKEKMKEGKRNKTKKVLQFDLQNNLIKEWRSAADAIDSTGLSGIYNCLTGISKQSGKFIWKYKE